MIYQTFETGPSAWEIFVTTSLARFIKKMTKLNEKKKSDPTERIFLPHLEIWSKSDILQDFETPF